MKSLIATTLALTLAACSQSPAATVRDGAPDNAVRMVMPEGEALPGARDTASTPSWAAAPDAQVARFGEPGNAPLVSVACREGVLVVTRHAAAPVGAQALFALVGREGILRLPVDATSVPGQRGYLWQGTIAADDARAAVMRGPFTGTLPGAGMIKVAAGSAISDVIARCRNSAPAIVPAPVAPAQTLE
ncbi:hypothetical protein HGI47_18670 [Novosphingobium sp. ERN07]|uniref:hypothetical protein n=1 Tax=Novosphingobium sp. ERN07 TaxID=2726187 RepID=UPI0014577BEC|nr:hypothetical protein [Novosphingobium sp. ERN07]NLR72903.1 hypothetical protein [Novosphingobium sp. ERN07]